MKIKSFSKLVTFLLNLKTVVKVKLFLLLFANNI